MDKFIFVDSKIRKEEEQKLKELDYKIIKLPKSNNVYEEISSHTDIFITKIENNIIIESNMYDLLLENSLEFNMLLNQNKIENKLNIIRSNNKLEKKYPKDIMFNLCIVGKKAIHNFKYTDETIVEILDKLNYEKININQGYSNCSIAVIDDNSCIVSDKKIKEELEKHNINVLYVENVDKNIKLLNKEGYSDMHGFIGGAIGVINDKIIIFGDLNFIYENTQIKEFIQSKNKQIINFKNISIHDYGGIITI